MLGLKEFGEISPHTFSLTVFFFLNCNRDPVNHLRRGAIPAPLNNVKSCDFSPSPATLWLWRTMFVFLFCFHMSWPALCLSLWLLLTVVFLGATEPSVISFLLLGLFCCTYQKWKGWWLQGKLVISTEFTPQCQNSLCVCVWEREIVVAARKGDSETKVVLSLV